MSTRLASPLLRLLPALACLLGAPAAAVASAPVGLPAPAAAGPASPLAHARPEGEELLRAARLRMLAVALRQADQPSGYWDPRQRDCAGFVRYLYRDSLGGRNRLWRDRSGREVDYVAADELIAYNFTRVGRDPKPDEIRTGDVLAFYSPHKSPTEAWHLIVLLEPPAAAEQRVLAIYHNGETGPRGQVRKVWLDDLLGTAASQWRPRPENPRFLGVYRWNGWSRLKERGTL